MAFPEKNTRKEDANSDNNSSQNDRLLQLGLHIKSFSYLTTKDTDYTFTFTQDSIKEPLRNLSHKLNQYTLYLLTIIPEDTLSESSSFNQTMNSIASNMTLLNKIGITTFNILYVIFFLKISHKENFELFFKESSGNQHQNGSLNTNLHFNASFMEYNYNPSTTLQLLLIHKPYVYATPIEVLDLFYIDLLNQFKSKESLATACQIANGVIIPETCLRDMIALFNTKSIGVVPLVETTPNGLFSLIEHYSMFQFNTYDMYYYYISCCIPLNHLISSLQINASTQEHIKTYFISKICSDASIDHHAFAFSLFLSSQGYQITLAKNIICNYSRNQITFDQMMQEYTDKQSAIYSCVIEIAKYWLDCSSFDQNCLTKTVLICLLLGITFDFCFPSMMALIVYAIIQEAFNIFTNDIGAKFFTSLYLILTCISIALSLIKKSNDSNIKDSYKIYLFLYGAFTVFYYFVLICSVLAIHFININKTSNEYKFNFIAMAILIVFNFIIGIIPLLMNSKRFFGNMLSALLYLTIGASGYTSLFLNYSIINSPDHIGTIKARNGEKDNGKEHSRKGLAILVYLLFNSIFLCVLFGMNTRAQRVNGVLSLGIIYTIYNFMKLFSIIGGYCNSPVKASIAVEGDLLNTNKENNGIKTNANFGKEVKEEGNNGKDKDNEEDDDKSNKIIKSIDMSHMKDNADKQIDDDIDQSKKQKDLSVEGIQSNEQESYKINNKNKNEKDSTNVNNKSIEIEFDDDAIVND